MHAPLMSYAPAVHETTEHADAAHVVAVTLVVHRVAHEFPQAPQFSRSVAIVASHPLAARPSQFAKPALHDATVHTPAAQPATPFAAVHTLPHAPQFETFAVVLVSQPSAGFALQSANPGSQAPNVQTPATHDSAAFGRLHAVPQPPQFASEPAVFVSHPFAIIPSQFANPVLHVPTAQAPATHAAVPLGTVHTVPHAPQFRGSVIVLTHDIVTGQRVGVIPEQPLAQTYEPIEPSVHIGVGSEHGMPHAPQLNRPVKSVSQPVIGSLPQ